MMMDCSTFKELNGLRPADLLDDEQLDLRRHLADCELCRREQRDDEELLALVDRWPRENSTITAADIRALDGLDTDLTASMSAPDPAPRTTPWLPIVMAIAAVLTLGALIAPRLVPERPVDPGIAEGQRLKGAADAAVPATELDLEFSVESVAMGAAMVQPGQESGAYGPDQGIIFGVQTDATQSLTLLERAPDGSAQVIGPGAGVRWAAVDGGTALMDDAGQRVAWRPDGATGTYHYTALLTDPPASTLPQDALDALLSGEAVEGVTLLAEDSFAIEWTAGERGVDVH
jgi:hypothetical protein